MDIRFLTPTIHGLLDYIAAIVLILAPSILRLELISPFAYWLSIAAGVALILYSLITDYLYSLAKILPFKVHLIIDLMAGIAFVVAPFLFGFTGIAMIYYVVMGVGVVLVVSFTHTTETGTPAAV